MAERQNFENGSERFEIHLEEDGRLHFKANNPARTRMVIADDSGEVTIGGSDEHGRIKLLNSSGRPTVDLDSELAVLTLGADDVEGDLLVLDSAGNTAIQLDGDTSMLLLFSSTGPLRANLMGEPAGRLQLRNGTGIAVDLRADRGSLTLGGGDRDGDIFVEDFSGNNTIRCNGGTGVIRCVSLTETSPNLTEESNGRLKTDIAPLMNALDSVLALRGVRYQRKQVTEPTAAAAGEAQQIGLIGQEVEAVCPELVATDAKGRKSVSYSRMTVVLVEAIKEQQQLIRDQAAALDEALGKISTIEAGLASHD